MGESFLAGNGLTEERRAYAAECRAFMRELGMFSVKAVFTLNSGAVVVMLAFIGNFKSEGLDPPDVWLVKQSAFFFIGGIVFSGMAIASSYLISQKKLAATLSGKEVAIGWVLGLQMGPIIVAFCAFLIGVISAISGLAEI